MNYDKFKGHTPGPLQAVCMGDSGYEVQSFGARVNSIESEDYDEFEDVCSVTYLFKKEDAELYAAAPELLKENERLRARVAELEAELTNAQISLDQLSDYSS